jgi:transcriptional antiterminator Rof (Rho-off)
MTEKYKPVSCNLYDELSNAVVLKRQINITTIDKGVMVGLIKDIYTKDKEEFCIIDDSHVRLDTISILSYKDNDSILRLSHWSSLINH